MNRIAMNASKSTNGREYVAAGSCNCAHAERAGRADGVDAIGAFICCSLNCALDRPGDAPVAFWMDDRVVVRIHHGLTRAERFLTQAQAERSLFQRYMTELTRRVHPAIANHVQRTLHRPVQEVQLDIDYTVGCIVFIVELGN